MTDTMPIRFRASDYCPPNIFGHFFYIVHLPREIKNSPLIECLFPLGSGTELIAARVLCEQQSSKPQGEFYAFV